MILSYTTEYLTAMMARDKAKYSDLDSVREWFVKTPLGHELRLENIYTDGHHIKLELK